MKSSDGTYTKISRGGGGGGGTATSDVMYVPFTVTMEQGSTELICTTTASYADVTAALSTGKSIVAQVDLLETMTLFMPLWGAVPSIAEPGVLAFGAVFDMNDVEDPPEPNLLTIQYELTGECNVRLVPLAVTNNE